jgi:hypothetical protein
VIHFRVLTHCIAALCALLQAMMDGGYNHVKKLHEAGELQSLQSVAKQQQQQQQQQPKRAPLQ